MLDDYDEGLDPTVHISGEFKAIGGTTRIGKQVAITEACEYAGSFKFNPYLALILNIEYDHTDYFRISTRLKMLPRRSKLFLKRMAARKRRRYGCM